MQPRKHQKPRLSTNGTELVKSDKYSRISSAHKEMKGTVPLSVPQELIYVAAV